MWDQVLPGAAELESGRQGRVVVAAGQVKRCN